jgi:hypothetical protein
MSDLAPPDIIYGFILLSGVALFAAWHEFKSRNQRDANVLAALGVAGLLGGAVSLL